MKQQDYQNALNYFDWYCEVEHRKEQNLLQELVDKEIPMKLVGEMYHRRCRLCGNPNLNTKWTYGNYCSGCGQKIDWSDEE